MWGALGAAGISAGAKLLGGWLDNKSSAKAQRMNIAMQREFAQKGIRWKVADAKAAGIHPLYALGAQTHSFSPVAIGSDYSSIGEAGQDIGRAIAATSNQSQRAGQMQKILDGLSVERAGLENDLLRSQIARLRQTPNPPMPVEQRYLVDGQGQTASGVPGTLIQDQPLARVPGNPAAMWMEPGAVTDVGHSRTKGGYAPVPSKDVKERIEDNMFQELQWFFRNNIQPMFGMNYSPPTTPPPEGYEWVYSGLHGAYVPKKKLFGPFYW